MQQYNVDFFKRDMTFVHNTLIDSVPIDDDYISSAINVIDIESTFLVAVGQFIRIQNSEYSFFGVVSDVSPGEYTTRVSYKSFITVFEDEVLFNTHLQGTGNASTRPTLESLIRTYLTNTYINTSDTQQILPISVTIDSNITQTLDWSFGYRSDDEEVHHKELSLYSELIVPALCKYGVVIDVNPSFHDQVIYLTITKRSIAFNISADLQNVTVKTLKYNDHSIGTNKLVVYNANVLEHSVIFYVHTDRTWDLEDQDRVTPVIQALRIVMPSENTDEAFAEAALEAAYSMLAGVKFDNLIELETYIDDVNIAPLDLMIGQTVEIWYNGASYSSILTGKKCEGNKVTLLFGSDRIEYTKRVKLHGG